MRKNKIFTSNNRLGLTLAVVVLISAALSLRLFFIQIISYQTYRDLAKKQQRFSEILEPERGDIYYKNKNGELVKAATTKMGALLYLNTKLLKEPENVFNKLAQDLKMNSAELDLYMWYIKTGKEPTGVSNRKTRRRSMP